MTTFVILQHSQSWWKLHGYTKYNSKSKLILGRIRHGRYGPSRLKSVKNPATLAKFGYEV